MGGGAPQGRRGAVGAKPKAEKHRRTTYNDPKSALSTASRKFSVVCHCERSELKASVANRRSTKSSNLRFMGADRMEFALPRCARNRSSSQNERKTLLTLHKSRFMDYVRGRKDATPRVCGGWVADWHAQTRGIASLQFLTKTPDWKLSSQAFSSRKQMRRLTPPLVVWFAQRL